MDTNGIEPNNSHSFVDPVVVEGCGIPSINGIYMPCGSKDGVPMYSKKSVYREKEVNFNIYRNNTFGGGTRTWSISSCRSGVGVGAEEILEHYVVFSASNELLPPQNNWKITEYGVGPPPRVYTESDDGDNVGRDIIESQSCLTANEDENDDAREVADRVVVGCGIPGINGVFKICGSHDGVPMFSRIGMWDGKEVEFTIHRFKVYNSESRKWYISIVSSNDKEPGAGFDIDFYVVTAKSSDLLPPRNHWGLADKGVRPAPRVYPENDLVPTTK